MIRVEPSMSVKTNVTLPDGRPTNPPATRGVSQTADFGTTGFAVSCVPLVIRRRTREALESQARTLNRACESIGRDPASLRRSLLAFRPLTPWARPGRLHDIADAACLRRFDELVLYKPASADERRVFENAVARLPSLKTFPGRSQVAHGKSLQNFSWMLDRGVTAAEVS